MEWNKLFEQENIDSRLTTESKEFNSWEISEHKQPLYPSQDHESNIRPRKNLEKNRIDHNLQSAKMSHLKSQMWKCVSNTSMNKV